LVRCKIWTEMKPMTETNYYKVLGISKDATTSEIKSRYRELVKQHHPDRQGDALVMARINKAYEVLSNPRLRFKYNQQYTRAIQETAEVEDLATNNFQQQYNNEPDNNSYKVKSKIGVVSSIIVVVLIGTILFVKQDSASKKVHFVNSSRTQTTPSQSSPLQPSTSSTNYSNTLNQKLAKEEALAKEDAIKAKQDQAIALQDEQNAQSLSQQNQATYNNLPTYSSVNGNSTISTISAPSSSPYPFASGSGELNGTYYYEVSYVTSNGTETSLSPPSLSVTADNQEILVTNIPTSSRSSVTERKLYRTKAGGSMAGPYYLVTTIYDNSTTSYFDNTPDSSLYIPAS